jgi:hypothetical protein
MGTVVVPQSGQQNIVEVSAPGGVQVPGFQNPLNTSGTYSFAPSMGEAVLYAYGLCGVRRTALTQQHFEDARIATNMLMARWSADGVNLWQVDLQCLPLVQGQATYPVPYNTIVMLDMYVGINSGAQEIDRILTPISRTEYANYPNKQQQGFPTVAWFDRLLSPTVTLWPVPNGQQTSFKYYRLRQTQDSNLQGAQNVEIPVYFLEPYVFGLATRLAAIWAPERAVGLKVMADESWTVATAQNRESGAVYISPQMSGYYR